MPEKPSPDADLMQRLSRLYAKMASSPADLAAGILAEDLAGVGADAGFVATVSGDGRTLEVTRVTPFSGEPVRLAFPLDAPYPLAKVMRDGDPIFIARNEQLRCDHPGLIRVKDEDHACATLPLLDEDGALIGAVNLGFEDPHDFTDDERASIEQVAGRCAQAQRAALAGPDAFR